MPYLLGALGLLVLLFIALHMPHRPRQLDERITLRQRDKIPYGMYAAHRMLQATFSNAHVAVDRNPPGYWPGIDTDSTAQAVFLVCQTFDPDSSEAETLTRFVRNGNSAFVITQSLGWDAENYFGLEDEKGFNEQIFEDSLTVWLQAPFAAAASFQYPGKQYDNFFTAIDTAKTMVLGRNDNGAPNFIGLQSGAGRLYVHLAPLTFSNYFLLHKSNLHYFQNVLSLVPANTRAILWNEYYLNRRTPKTQEPSVLRVLWQYQSFRWGLLTIIGTLLLYVLSAMRRQQRLIPLFAKPANDSLDFVRTIGRLYYDRRDHHNLAKKMALYFGEHVRSRYKILNPNFDETFLEELQQKSGYGHGDLKNIVDFIHYINTYNFITEAELARFYKQLNTFYKSTNGTTV